MASHFPPSKEEEKEGADESSFSVLDAGSDEEKIVALLLLARREDELKKNSTLSKKVSEKLIENRFLERLLKTESHEESSVSLLSESQRAGLAVTMALASSSENAAAIFMRLAMPIVELAEACVKNRVWDDLLLCLQSLEAIPSQEWKRASASSLLETLALCSSEHKAWQLALSHMTIPKSIGDAKNLLQAAKKQSPGQIPLLALSVAVWASDSKENNGIDWVSRHRSSEARKLRENTETAIFAALPRLFIQVQDQRDDLLRLTAISAQVFGLCHPLLTPDTMKLLASIFAAEARLALDQALAILEESTENPQIIQTKQEERIRLAQLISLCLAFLLQLIDALLGGDNIAAASSDSDSDDEATLADTFDPDTILSIRSSLLDAADAALSFSHHTHLLWAKENVSPPESTLALCRDLFRFLGRLALELDDDDDDDDDIRPSPQSLASSSSSYPQIHDESTRLNIHARLQELNPFINYLIALDANAE